MALGWRVSLLSLRHILGDIWFPSSFGPLGDTRRHSLVLGRGEPSVMCCHLLPLAPAGARRKCRIGPLSFWRKGTGLNSWDAFTHTDQGVSQMEQSSTLLSIQASSLAACLSSCLGWGGD